MPELRRSGDGQLLPGVRAAGRRPGSDPSRDGRRDRERGAARDGKLWATLQVLFRRPGELTIAYVGGKRATYVAPLRLYLTASVLYFFIVAVAPDLSTPVVRYTESDTSSAPTRAGSGLVVTATRSRTDTAVPAGLGGRARRRLEQGVQRAARDPTQFGARIRDNMGTVVFLVLPAFAFAVGLAYRRRRRHFPQHMVFALHVHAVAFLLFALAALARFTRVQVFAATMGVITLAVVVAYIVVALRRVYGGTWAATVGKTIALGVVYFVFYVAGSLTLALYSLMTS